MYYVVYYPRTYIPWWDSSSEIPVLEDLKEARQALKKHPGSRMKAFDTYFKALDFKSNPDCEDPSRDLAPVDTSQLDLSTSLERLSIRGDSPAESTSSPIRSSPSPNQPAASSPKTKVENKNEVEIETFPSATPAMLNQLRRNIEAGKYEEVEQAIWSNPRCLVTVCDSAVYLMAGPKYNACHIAARANKPDMMALLLDTVTNPNFLRKLYPQEPDHNVQERLNHLIDSYLNTPDPKQGCTPLHFACKKGFYRVVRVLLTFEGCDLNLRDSGGLTAEESICTQCSSSEETDKETQALKVKIRNMFKGQLHLPLYRDQLRKRLILARRRNQAARTGSDFEDSDTSFSDDSFMSTPGKSIASPVKFEVI